MARPLPNVPHPSVPVTESDGRLQRDWRTLLIELAKRVPVPGSATFAAGTSIAVTFAIPEMDTSYRIVIEPQANRTYWVTSKSTTGFTLNASASNSDTVNWALLRG